MKDVTWPVTVYVPTYNQRPAWLHRAVTSAVTAGAEQVLVIDDGSDTPVRNAWGERVEVVRIEHGGVPAAMNAAVPRIRCRWFARLPSDDWYLPEKFEVQIPWMERHELRASHTGYLVASAGGQVWDDLRGRFDRVWPRLKHDNCIYGATTIVESELMREIGGHKPHLTWCHDWDLHCEIATRTVWGVLTNATMVRRIHSDSMSATAPHDEYNRERAAVHEYWRNR